MRGHWLSAFALAGIAAFAGGALFSRAVENLDETWLTVAVAAGVAAALVLHRVRAARRQR